MKVTILKGGLYECPGYQNLEMLVFSSHISWISADTQNFK